MCSLEKVVAELFNSYVHQPDYSIKREEIESHPFVLLKHDEINPATGQRYLSVWNKVLFTTSDCAVCQEVLITWNVTRFRVRKIELSDWDNMFVEWIDENHDRYLDVYRSWDEGYNMYGANV